MYCEYVACISILCDYSLFHTSYLQNRVQRDSRFAGSQREPVHWQDIIKLKEIGKKFKYMNNLNSNKLHNKSCGLLMYRHCEGGGRGGYSREKISAVMTTLLTSGTVEDPH